MPWEQLASRAMLRASLGLPDALYLRLGRGRDPEVYPVVPEDFAFGRAVRLLDGTDATIIATGSEILRTRGVLVRVLDMHTIKPLDDVAVLAAAKETGRIVVAEEHLLHGGLGSAVAMSAARQHPVPMRFVGINDTFAESGKPDELLAKYGLTAADIVKAARDLPAKK